MKMRVRALSFVLVVSVILGLSASSSLAPRPEPGRVGHPAAARTQPKQWALVSAQTSATAIACSEVTHTPGDYIVKVESSGQTRQFRLHVPPGYQSGSPTPLVINLHGYSGNGAQQERMSAMVDKADEAGFIAVHPEGRGDPQKWHVGPTEQGEEDVQFMVDLIQCLDLLSIDSARIYATGFSNGGGMTNRLACDLSDSIAAIGPVSGDYQYKFFRDCEPARPVPVAAFHGTADQIVPYDGVPGLLPPIPEWAAAWAVRNGCDLTSTTTFSQGVVTGETWDDCVDDAVVTLYTIEGGGHTWPGSDVPGATRDIIATDTICKFFAAHPMRGRVYLALVMRAY